VSIQLHEDARLKVPLVSVCLPNLNTLPYLRERLDTIVAQTHKNWELVVSDNYSEDGAWEFLEEAGRRDERIALARAPRQGMYANWNNCINRARGEYVYIATSDDTMAPDCLERLVEALEHRPDCDLAHCALKVIDQTGSELGPWWSDTSMFAESSGDLINRRHARYAPFDGLLHLSGTTVYTSITQLLIRRCLFERVGLFEGRWGSVGDYNWCMRASLVANTVHIPDTWASWRWHTDQATAKVKYDSPEHETKIREMIVHAIGATESSIPEAMSTELRRWLAEAENLRGFLATITAIKQPITRWAYILAALGRGREAAWRHIVSRRLSGRPLWPDFAKQRASQCGVTTVLQELPATASA
jgi:glycosyltransferase involved in cell wall biosynthesis